MKRVIYTFLGILTLASHQVVYAQAGDIGKKDPKPPALESCGILVDGSADQLECFRQYGVAELAKRKKAYAEQEQVRLQKQDDVLQAVQIRDTAAIGPAGAYDIGSKPGSFQLGSSDGQSISTAKIALLGKFQPINSGPLRTWTPFFAIGWDRDLSSKTPKDLRQVSFGIQGNVTRGDPSDQFMVYSTLRAGHRIDIRSDTDSDFVNANFDLYYVPWIEGKKGNSDNYKAIYFPVGLWTEHKFSSTSTPLGIGTRNAMYFGAKVETNLFGFTPRLTANASTQWFHDMDAPNGFDKRSLRYSTVGINYDLVDPKATTGWVPSIGLLRQVGSNPVTGEGPVGKTVLSLGIRFDS